MVAQEQRLGSWMQTFTGKAIHPLDMRVEDVDIRDIAHALSLQCRYAGHCKKFFSVAEHSYIVSTLVPSAYALAGLLHDASEAYLVDVPRPVKPYLTNYKPIERGVMTRIAQALGLHPLPSSQEVQGVHPPYAPYEVPACVKLADERILHTERDQLMAPAPRAWQIDAEPVPGLTLYAWPPDVAEANFLSRFARLMEARARG